MTREDPSKKTGENRGTSLAAAAVMHRVPLLALVAFALTVAACQSATSDDPLPTDPDSGTPTDPPDSGTPDDDAAATLKPLPSAKAKQIGAGLQHTCALTEGGEVRCWGGSDKGQLGNGAPYESGATTIPVQVTGLTSGVQAISVGSDFSCAVTAAGGVKCWGTDEVGQLGTGIPYVDSRMQASNVPVDVKDLGSGAVAVSAGGSSACAIIAEGAVKCWGLDEYGKLGNASTHTAGDGMPSFLPPVTVQGMTGAVQISVGGHHACAVLASGALKCWGGNARGALGIGTDEPSKRVPVDVTALGTDVVRVEAGSENTCAVLKSGSMKCWGEGDEGQLGDGMTGIIRHVLVPQDVLGVTGGVTSVSLNGFACAVISGATRCWGKSAKLGSTDEQGFETYAPAKEAVGLGTGSAQVSVGSQHACALTADGAVKCWGDDTTGNLGDGKDVNGGTARQKTPTAVVSLP